MIPERSKSNIKKKGSSENQIESLAISIKTISDHLNKNYKDHNSRRALLIQVAKMKKLQKYCIKHT